MVLEVVAALVGSTIGAVAAVGARGRAHPFAAGVALIGIAAAVVGAPGPIVSVAAAIATAAALVDLRWSSRPEAAHRLTRTWDRATVRRVVAAETFGRPVWALPAVAAAVTLGTLAGSIPMVAAAAATTPITAWLRRRRPGAVAGSPPPPDDDVEAVVVVRDDSPARDGFDRVVDDIVGRGKTPAVAVSPPHLFRGLGGWNLGLGLDAEQAGWAGQLARSLGLADVLAAPETTIGTVQARKLAVCRAMASPGEVVVLDEPAAGLEPHDVKAVADVVERALAGRRLVVVTSDVAGHRTFVSKVRSRT